MDLRKLFRASLIMVALAVPAVPNEPEAISQAVNYSASPGLFAQHASRGKWVFARHLKRLDKAITDTIAGVDGCRRLLVCMPPRHGKSMIDSEYLPAWYVGTFPDKRVMLCGYGDTFARDWGRKSRDILKEWGPQLFNVAVRTDKSAADEWGVVG